MQGVIAAVPTALDNDGQPAKAPFLEHCNWALANGCDGLNILGSTGEANSLDRAARMQVMEWAAEALPKERLMVGTGTPSLAETIALTAHADDLGYRVALVLPPYYYTPASDDGLYEWYRALHEALGERAIEIYFYNFPQMTGIPLPVSVITRLNRDMPTRFTGIKDSSADLPYCRELISAIPGFRVFPSSETALGEAAASGFAGCISATVNVSAVLCGQIWAAREDVPQDMLVKAAALRNAVAAHPLIPAVKEMVARRTGDMEWRRVMPPFMELSEEARAELSVLEVD